ncbi:MAG: methyltransferase [Deltaproteobacteria bacterium]|nr:methyltransferase [Deltaproteobacteria bacterium]MBW2598195.1 methyltransferase [Deltaproteobacteria bacterium]MBW2639210.1 methyltransferase [Deltaproteobacteria bacterium]MBW2679710.1 methyltransferase [Deltaproteobacteria bacterium]
MTAKELKPEKILKLSGSYWETCTLHAGVKLDVFTIISKDRLKGEDVADKLKGDKRGVKMLLNALSAMDLLVKKEDIYSNTPLSLTFLSKDSPRYMGHIILHHHNLIESWSRLDMAVRSGRSVRHRVTHTNEEQRENFLMGMFNLAMNLAPVLAPKVDLSGRRHLLDLGGGPGTYAIHFCMNNPRLKATVYDLPTTRPFAEKTIAKFKLQNRIDFKDVDYLKEDIKGIYDVVWLSHILHGEGPEDCRNIIGKAVSALEPGGMILIHDFILNDSMDGPLFPALFSLNMLLVTPSGQSYSEKQIRDMLSDAGVREIRRISFESPNDSGIITGIV